MGGSAIGTIAGAVLGSIVPGVGTALGATLGGALGGGADYLMEGNKQKSSGAKSYTPESSKPYDKATTDSSEDSGTARTPAKPQDTSSPKDLLDNAKQLSSGTTSLPQMMKLQQSASPYAASTAVQQLNEKQAQQPGQKMANAFSLPSIQGLTFGGS